MWAIVTGGSSGLGFAIARQLAAEGYDLVLVSRSEAKLRDAADRILAELGGGVSSGNVSSGGVSSGGVSSSDASSRRILIHPLDLSCPQAPASLVEWTLSQKIVPDVLVNNAGMYIYSPICRISADSQDCLLNLNIGALSKLCRLYAQQMQAGSHILNIASYSVYMPIEGFSLYAGSKAFVRTFSRCISKELRHRGIRVTAVAPAGMDTGLMKLRPEIQKTARRLGFLRSPEAIARISLRVMRAKYINYWIPGWYNVLFIPFLRLFQPLFKKVL